MFAGWYFNDDSTPAGADASKSPSYPTQQKSNPNTKLYAVALLMAGC
jgi:hypothetical protein